MIKTLFLGLTGTMSIVLFACIASYYKELKNLLREKLNIRKMKISVAAEWKQFEEVQQLLDNECKSIFEEDPEYQESKPVYSSQTQPLII